MPNPADKKNALKQGDDLNGGNEGQSGGDENKILSTSMMKLGDKTMSLSEFIGVIGLESRLRLWANKMYQNQQKTGFEWSQEFQKQGAIEQVPSVLNQPTSL